MSHPSGNVVGMYRLTKFAADHHGLFTVDVARRAHVPDHVVAHAFRLGITVRVHECVYRFAAVPITWESSVLAACWAGGCRAVASHRTAAEVHSMPGGDRRFVEVSCPRWRRIRHEGVTVHESHDWCSRDHAIVGAIPVTSPALTLLHLAAVVSRSMLERAFEDVLRRDLATLAEIDDVLRRYARRGRPGVRNLRALVHSRQDSGVKSTESDPETILVQIIRGAGLPEPVRQLQIYDKGRKIARVDLGYPDAKIAIEYDSDQFHTGRVASDRDSRRRHVLIAAGWLPMIAIRTDLQSGARDFCAALGAALRDRARLPAA